jgi:hypothetical protein
MQEQSQSELDFLGEQLMDLYAEWQYVQDQIQQEMEYNVAQAADAVREAVVEAKLALADPVSEREAVQFAEEMKKQLSDFISTESFQAAPGDNKEMWLAEKFKEQQQALEDKFGERRDDFENREALKDRLAELQQSAMEVVKREQEIEKKLQSELEVLKKAEAETKERLERNIQDKALLEEKTKQTEELAAKLEEQRREQAEKERQAMYEKWLEEQRQREEERLLEEQRRQEEYRRQAAAASRSFGFD